GAAGGIALINSFGAVASWVCPSIVGRLEDVTGKTAPGLYVVAGIVALGCTLILLFVPPHAAAEGENCTPPSALPNCPGGRRVECPAPLLSEASAWDLCRYSHGIEKSAERWVGTKYRLKPLILSEARSTHRAGTTNAFSILSGCCDRIVGKPELEAPP